jgi:hypothetical protein
MAKNMNYAKITLDSGNGEVYTGEAGMAGISSTNGGMTHSVVLGPVYNLKKEAAPFTQQVGGTTSVPGISIRETKRDAVLKALILQAKRVDKQAFEGARLVELAEAEAQDAYNKVMHEFHLSVLSALHEDMDHLDVKEALDKAGLEDFEGILEQIRDRDVKKLYPGLVDDSEE